MKKKIKKFLLLNLILILLLNVNNILAVDLGFEPLHPPQQGFNITRPGNTYLRRTATGASIGAIGQSNRVTLPPASGGMVIAGNWTWIQFLVSNARSTINNTVHNGLYWISTSQITPESVVSGTCAVASGTVVRNTPGGVNQGLIGVGANFEPWSHQIQSGGWTWVLGTIRGNAAGTNGWSGRMMWVATSQLTGTNPLCN